MRGVVKKVGRGVNNGRRALKNMWESVLDRAENSELQGEDLERGDSRVLVEWQLLWRRRLRRYVVSLTCVDYWERKGDWGED